MGKIILKEDGVEFIMHWDCIYV